MAVSEDVRRVEREIDERVAELPLWRCAREAVVRAALDYYRGAIEVLLMMFPFAATQAQTEAIEIMEHALLQEGRVRAGIFYVLKWALARCPERSARNLNDRMIHTTQEIGAHYEALVDALKMGEYGVVEIEVDRPRRRLTVYEGGDLTGNDWALVEHQRRTNPLRNHMPLTEDTDQLTRTWTAGDYRRTMSWLAAAAANAEGETVMFAPPGVEPVPAFSRPVVLTIPDPPEPEMRRSLDDLTLTAEKVGGRGFYRYTTFLDAPIVAVGTVRLAPSDALKALATTGDDHMLRLAALADGAQYQRVSGLRESRMIAECERVLSPQGWTVMPRFKLRNPSGDVDVYAERGQERLAMQLKSTLRPESPWEVRKRNDDLLVGIAQADAARQLGDDVTALVITDGYRGDYAVWQMALERRVGVGALEDVADVGREAAQAFDLRRRRVGFERQPSTVSPRPRTCDLMGWSLRLVDDRRKG